jgi:putative oxidoreductase
MKDISLLLLRGVSGGLVAAHGAQKLFGWFGGGGIEGTRGMMQHLNLKPEREWAYVAALSEFGGGVLTTLGFLNPLGPIGITSAMSMATAKVHWGKPIWVSAGGPELTLTNISIAFANATLGPGKLSLDHALGIRLPRVVAGAGIVLAAAGVATGMIMSSQKQEQPAQQEHPAQEEQPQPESEAEEPMAAQKPQSSREQEFVDDTPAPVTPAAASAVYFGQVHPVYPDSNLNLPTDTGMDVDNPA